MNYLLFFLFLFGSFVMADEGTLGVVRILNTQPPKYDYKTGKIIPDSMNTVLRIRKIHFDKRTPGKVGLIAHKDDQYDAVLIQFHDHSPENSNPQRFGEFLFKNPNFTIDLIEEDLQFDSSTFLSILKVRAEKVRIKTSKMRRSTLLKNIMCPIQTQTGIFPWMEAKAVRVSCL